MYAHPCLNRLDHGLSLQPVRRGGPRRVAGDALLATHAGGDPLSHGHGRPLRLVAPDRRGFQWVKWVESVEVRTAPDPGQWLTIFTSWLKK